MKICTTKIALEAHLSTFRQVNKSIGFVATMGALHEGHLCLIQESKKNTAITVCSIFVNPTQFNDPADLEKYPRPLEQDISLLQSVNCDVLFLPEVVEMYPPAEQPWHFDIGDLDRIWEGARRPGHYQGVTQIVKKLFDAVKPDIAFFGQKDFQQCMVIQHMIAELAIPLQLKIVDTVRDADGLAKSSRNVRLSSKGREEALALSKALFMVKKDFEEGASPRFLKKKGEDFLRAAEGVEIEYFAICEPTSLQEVDIDEVVDEPLVAIIAAWVDGVRLIDNVILRK